MKNSPAPNIVLLDVQLPGMDGISALSEIKKMSPETSAIILTAFDDSDKIFKAMCSGASGYLLKSGLKDEISYVIREVIDGGAPMTPTVAKKVLSQFSNIHTPTKSVKDYKLSDREIEVLRCMADGLIKKEIAHELHLSIHTINSHIRSIYAKLHVDTNTGAVAKSIREQII
ncbi:MAG: response regulator transcription factor [Planctomycetes bacterium]|nr:response regulator transcription factor [Planctomycetota bacterium]